MAKTKTKKKEKPVSAKSEKVTVKAASAKKEKVNEYEWKNLQIPSVAINDLVQLGAQKGYRHFKPLAERILITVATTGKFDFAEL